MFAELNILPSFAALFALPARIFTNFRYIANECRMIRANKFFTCAKHPLVVLFILPLICYRATLETSRKSDEKAAGGGGGENRFIVIFVFCAEHSIK